MTDNISLQELLHEREWRVCFPDWDESTDDEKLEAFAHFCRTHWKIRHPDPRKGRIAFELSEAQLEAAECFLTERNTLVLKARQVGFSTLVAAFCFWRAYGYQNTLIAMLSKGQREAGKLLNKAKYGWRNLPNWMKYYGPVVPKPTMEKMTFGHDSEIESLPSGSNPARGESVTIAVIDEWAFLPNPDEAWASIEPIADVGGQVIALSTANGEGNIFHTQWASSKGGGNGTGRFRGIFFPWWQCAATERDQAWYDAKAAVEADWFMAQEYPDNPEDAFLRSGRPVFTLAKIREWEPVLANFKGYLKRDFDGKLDFEDDGGALSIWEPPEAKVRYVIGADVAEGLEHGDYSSAHVINARTTRVVAHWHGHIDVDLYGEDILNLLGLWYNKALIGVERNNMGIATIKALQRAKYPCIYRDRTQHLRAPTPTESMGWFTTPQKKGLMVAELNGAFRNGVVVPDLETIQELKTYVREGNGKMHGSPHDDRVMSLALANQMLKYVFLKEYQPKKEEPGPGTWGWFDKFAYPKKNQGGSIGSQYFRKSA